MSREPLESTLPDLRELHLLRESIVKLRTMGLTSMISPPPDAFEEAGDEVEDALVCLALSDTGGVNIHPLGGAPSLDTTLRILRDKIADSVTRCAFTQGSQSTHVRILWLARAMQALLTQMPLTESAFHAITISYYCILFELRLPRPGGALGTARASSDAPPSSFVTSECLRALALLRDCFTATANYAQTLLETARRLDHLEAIRPQVGDAWSDCETRRVLKCMQARLSRLEARSAIRRHPESSFAMLDRSALMTSIRDQLTPLIAGIRSALQQLEFLDSGIRSEEQKREGMADASPSRSDSRYRLEAHEFAIDAIRRPNTRELGNLYALVDRSTSNPDLFFSALEAISGLRVTADGVHSITEVCRPFISQSLYKEMTRADSPNSICDYHDLAFAARTFSLWKPDPNDPDIGRALNLLFRGFTNDGRWPLGDPIRTDVNGHGLYVLTGEVIRSLAGIVRGRPGHFSVQDALVLSRRALAYYTRTKTSFGWRHEHRTSNNASGHRRGCLWVSAIHLIGLRSLHTMLDSVINYHVLDDFTVQKFSATDNRLTLDAIMWPDYGISQLRIQLEPQDSPHAASASLQPTSLPSSPARQTIADVACDMLSHLTGPQSSTFSAVLYGPPGTGKTTFLEALAKSAGVPLVEITPSDLVVGGEAGVERRARTVFDALRLLTDVAISFDEFDPVLRRRDDKSESARSTYSFLTASMLPKLKTLYTAAKQQRIVYCLLTNKIATLDGAAIRGGRLDVHIGAYLPDPISRVGRCVDIVSRGAGRVPNEWLVEILRCASRAAKKPMDTLGRAWSIGKALHFCNSTTAGEIERLLQVSSRDAENDKIDGEGDFVVYDGVTREILRRWDESFTRLASQATTEAVHDALPECCSFYNELVGGKISFSKQG